MSFVNVYLDLTSVHACLCSVCFLLCVRVCECLYFILILYIIECGLKRTTQLKRVVDKMSLNDAAAVAAALAVVMADCRPQPLNLAMYTL